MASAVFQLEDTQETRNELSLLLQIDPSQISKISSHGFLTVEFSDLAEDKVLQVLSRSVSNHGFTTSIISRPVGIVPEARVEPKTPAPVKATTSSSKGNKN